MLIHRENHAGTHRGHNAQVQSSRSVFRPPTAYRRGGHALVHARVQLLLEAEGHLLQHIVDVEDAAGRDPQLLDDAQHEDVRAREAGEEERLQRQDALARRVGEA